jgi:hypothetical protein
MLVIGSPCPDHRQGRLPVPRSETLAMIRVTPRCRPCIRRTWALLRLLGGALRCRCLRPRPTLTAEPLLLHNSLALDQARTATPRRAPHATRLAWPVVARWCAGDGPWRSCAVAAREDVCALCERLLGTLRRECLDCMLRAPRTTCAAFCTPGCGMIMRAVRPGYSVAPVIMADSSASTPASASSIATCGDWSHPPRPTPCLPAGRAGGVTGSVLVWRSRGPTAAGKLAEARASRPCT